MNTLVLTCGLPRSGKSTWARKTGHPVVSPDAIRLALHGHVFVPSAERHVWAVAHTMVEALFLAGHRTVILDACNTTPKRRDEWEDPRWRLNVIHFPATAEECIERARARGRADLVPVIERMAAEMDF